MVIPFEECIARPQKGGMVFLLTEHLQYVAQNWGSKDGTLLEKFYYLGGLLHDAGKAKLSWQEYVRDPSRKRGQGPPHSPLSAFLFSFFAHNLLESMSVEPREKKGLYLEIMKIAKDIYDHHTQLRDLTREPPWDELALSSEALNWNDLDLPGLSRFIRGKFPEAGEAVSYSLTWWVEDCREKWENWFLKRDMDSRLKKSANGIQEAAKQCFREKTSRLIVSDRYHAGGMEERSLRPSEAEKALERFTQLCATKAEEALREGKVSAEMIKIRQTLQERVVQNYLAQVDEKIFSLTMPTGSGKTLTGLKIGLMSCLKGKCSRIIYVAPYLSILDQATKEIKETSGLEVLQHHHLSVLQNNQEKAESQEEEAFYLVLDSWQAPVVTTTFNQLFRGLFPQRAQQTLRLGAMEKAFVIVDEPQIIDKAVWALFLRMLEAAVESCHMQVVLMTATLPITEAGLNKKPVTLAPPVVIPDRYCIKFLSGTLNEDSLGELIIIQTRQVNKIGIVMNTVRDAVDVYLLLRERTKGVNVFLLTGCMASLHKIQRIKEISEALSRSDEKTIVVATQIIEAGVNFSFQRIFRALPIIPSVAQVAGRGNRHGEGDKAVIYVFTFKRNNEKDTRNYVYTEKDTREVTDEIFKKWPEWNESKTAKVVSDYYNDLFSRNMGTTFVEKLYEGASGTWSSLAGIEPFNTTYPQIPVFVPLGNDYLNKEVLFYMQKFGVSDSESLYEIYRDSKYIRGLSFHERKQFFGLLGFFIVNLSKKIAERIGLGVSKDYIPLLTDPKLYSSDMGLGHLTREDDIPMCIVW